MINVEQAQALCLDLVTTQPAEPVNLHDALGRVLAAPLQAGRDQPPFSASAMDGYAVRSADIGAAPTLTVIGEAAAGHNWQGTLGPGEALRIFTGAPLPQGADRVVLQEDVERIGNQITLGTNISNNINIRPQGADFKSNFLINHRHPLAAPDLALIAAMNHDKLQVARKPRVALISTGDELVMPGAEPRSDQIIASNVFALHAMAIQAGAVPRIFPIAADRPEALDEVLSQAETWGADVLVTIGGASVGDHDLVAPALDRFGVRRSFHKIAMRPGKPLMAGAKGRMAVIGLPGNPVSAIVCGHLFLMPMLRHALGQDSVLPPRLKARLNTSLAAGGPRAHYMRARFKEEHDHRSVTVFDRQDSSMLTILAEANCLALQPIQASAKAAGEAIDIFPI